MRFRKEINKHGDFVVRGDIYLTKECWAKVCPINEVRDQIYALSDTQCSALSAGTEKGKTWTSLPVLVTLIANVYGFWDEPEHWYAEPKWVVISQNENLLYDGPYMRGLSGEIHTKSKGLFTSMGFFYDFFREDIKKYLQEEIDSWIMES